MNRYFLDPFGCVKNQVDAENMMFYLQKAGWESVSEAEAADLIIVNSCGFIESAKQESINAVLEWRKHYPGKKILLAGCLAQRYAKDLKEILPEADNFLGVGDPSQVVKAAQATLETNPVLSKIKSSPQITFTETGERPLLSLPGSAYVKISEGCSNNCSYCAIPLIRGELVSRSIPDIIDECRLLLKRGIVELNIIGQDVGAYGMDKENKSKLPELLNAISKLEGHFWVRLLYIHPDHFPLQILDIIERDKRFLPYFDIPFQHAAPEILTVMNRKGTAETHLTLLETIRTRLPDAVIRSTFMLGFPGETEEHFAALLDFQKKANLDWLGCFVYSREEGTTSYSMKGRVPAKIAAKRKQTIEERQISITEKNMKRFTGLTLDVLVEELFSASAADPDETNLFNEENIWLGRLYCQAPEVDGAAVIVSTEKSTDDLQLGTLIKCKVAARRGFDLEVQV